MAEVNGKEYANLGRVPYGLGYAVDGHLGQMVMLQGIFLAADDVTGECFPSRPTLGQGALTSSSQQTEAIKALEGRGFITVIRSVGKENHYVLNRDEVMRAIRHNMPLKVKDAEARRFMTEKARDAASIRHMILKPELLPKVADGLADRYAHLPVEKPSGNGSKEKTDAAQEVEECQTHNSGTPESK